jgi:hypothetical protein
MQNVNSTLTNIRYDKVVQILNRVVTQPEARSGIGFKGLGLPRKFLSVPDSIWVRFMSIETTSYGASSMKLHVSLMKLH